MADDRRNRQTIVAAQWDDADENEHLPQYPEDIDEIWGGDRMAIVEYDDGDRVGALTAEYPVSVRR